MTIPRTIPWDSEAYWHAQLDSVSATTFAPRARFSPDITSHGQVSRDIPSDPWSVGATTSLGAIPWAIAAWAVLLRRYGASAGISLGLRMGIAAEVLPLSIVIDRHASGATVAQDIAYHLSARHDTAGLRALLDRRGPVQVQEPPLSVTVLRPDETTTHTHLPGIELTISAGTTPRWILSWRGVPTSESLAAAALAHMERLFAAIVRSPDRLCRTLPLLSHEEHREIVERFNDTHAPFPDQQLLHEAFQKRAASCPDAIAAVFQNQGISYGDLNLRANQLAHALLRRGVSRESLVGVCVERGFELLVAVIAVAKTGAAYVPLEPSGPPDRLRFMLEDTRAAVVLTTSRSRDRLPPGADTIEIDLPSSTFHDEPISDPVRVAEPEDLAYVIYTSGSTGVPKGVAVRHRSAVNLIDWVNTTYSVSSRDRLLFVTSICFDLSVYDVFGILSAGGCIEIASEEDLVEPRRLARLLEGREITFWDSAPAALAQLVPFLSTGSESLRIVFLSGDWIPVPLPDQVRASFPRARVVALGGATEATIWSNYYEIEEVHPGWPSIPYGKPIRNARYYVLDDELQVLPKGVPGRLYIGGLCVAAGYHNRKDLTTERFVPDPFSSEADARLYNTGDSACHLPDGNLELLGRLDSQVKVRGYRVELGELEVVLNRHESVSNAACIVRKDVSGQNALFAYVVPSGGPVNVKALRHYLSAILPEYMVPAHVISLARVPITPNGKVDHRALSDMAVASDTACAAPVGNREEALCRMFSAILGRRSTGRDDDFFQLGGHSLLAVLLVSRLRGELAVELDVREVFAHPTPRRLAAFLDENDASAAVDTLPAPSRHDETDRQPLSSSQERLWFVEQLQPGRCVHNIVEAFALRGDLDSQRLERALARIVERHSALRTSFHSIDGVPYAKVGHLSPPLLRVDARNWKEEELNQALLRAAREPFQLAAGGLLRMHLYRRDEREHVLLLVIHHMVVDGWSLQNLYRELRALYKDGDGAELRELPVQSSDFALWERELAQSKSVREQLRQWAQELSGVPPLELPTDLARPPWQSCEGDAVEFEMSSDLLGKVERLASANQATAFMVFLALYQVLLARYSGQSDFAVGIPVSTRARPEFEPLIGFLLNTLPLRMEYRASESVNDLVGRVREQSLQMLTRREVPFEELVKVLKASRDENRSPVFQAVFAYQAEAPELGDLGSLRSERRSVGFWPSRLDLMLDLQRRADGAVKGLFEYATTRMSREMVEQMAGHLLRLVHEAVEHPTFSVGALEMLTTGERWQLVRELNQTERDFDFTRCVHQLFEDRVAENPNALAIVFGKERVGYGELDRRARRIAWKLRGRGVGKDALVGICLDRTPNTLAAILGVLKAGAAYVPLDPSFPAERIAYMVSDSGVHCVLTEPRYHDLIASPSVEKLDIDALTAEGEELQISAGEIDALAYVLYTSGSTGRPKGVEVTQKNVVNFLKGAEVQPGLRRDDRILALATLNFDISVVEILLPLSVGAEIALLKADEAMAGYQIAELLERYQVSVLQAGPTLLRNLLSTGWVGDRGLKVICTGEAFPPDLQAPLVERAREVWNGYGPTETTVWSSVERMTARRDRVSVGRPMPNTRMYVLDSGLAPVPFGVRGELYIGGLGVARGYRGRPDLTDERFLASPFVAGERLYRTGDVAVERRDGRFEIFGRTDGQVSLNGHRIEIGEVESVLLGIVGIRECAVMVREDHPGTKVLVGYVVAEGSLDPAAVRMQAARLLPPYMVPTRYVQLAALPQTPNGKLDRNALPKPGEPSARREKTPPRNAVEEALGEVFRDVLGIDTPDIDDNFFDLGGSSLQTIQAIDRLNKRGVAVTAAQVFRFPTIRQLAAAVAARLAESDDSEKRGTIVVMREFGSRPPLFLLHSLPGDLLGYGDLVQALGQDQPVYGFHGLGTGLRNMREVHDLAELYAGQLHAHWPKGLIHLGGWCFGGTVALEMAQILRSRNRQIGLIGLIEAYPSRSPFSTKMHALRAVLTRRVTNRIPLSTLLRRLTRMFIEAPERGDVFALDITEGPFAHRAETYERNRAADERHRTRSYSGEICLIRAEVAGVGIVVDEDYGWSGFADNVRVHEVASAAHEDIIHRPHCQEVARIIREEIDRAEQRLAVSPAVATKGPR